MSGSGGRRPRRVPRAPRGTMFVAALRRGQPTVWEFAVDRSAGVALRNRLNHARARVGRTPLPFVEALHEFPPLPVVLDGDPLDEEAAPEPADEQWDRNGEGDLGYDEGDPLEEERPPARRRRLPIVIGVVLAIVAIELVVSLLIIRGG